MKRIMGFLLICVALLTAAVYGAVLPAPLNLAVSDASDSKWELSWDALPSTHNAWYEVMRSVSPTVGVADVIGTTHSAFFKDMSAVPGIPYYYRVRAVNLTDTPSAVSAMKTTHPLPPPYSS
ncbi:MAG TPA: fibronectin type III domain-containing protein, partial [Candidatus Goldiibacteriota bacterium]|nr:fibronectin type III domain-containing protein [Candidatus Goldiibacteriota bacterium]